jgi:acyl-CoA reductase-like NAD-dependent aldehyde dehydrogenase
MDYQSRSPFNGKVLKTYDDLSDQGLESAVSRAEQVYEVAWSKEPMRQRAAVLKRAGFWRALAEKTGNPTFAAQTGDVRLSVKANLALMGVRTCRAALL